MIDDNELLLILMDIEPIVGICSGIYRVEFSVSRIVERYLYLSFDVEILLLVHGLPAKDNPRCTEEVGVSTVR